MKNIGLFFLFFGFIFLYGADTEMQKVLALVRPIEAQRNGQPFECLPCSVNKGSLLAFSTFTALEQHRNRKDPQGCDIPTACHHQSMVALYQNTAQQRAYSLLREGLTDADCEVVDYVVKAYQQWKNDTPFLCVSCAVAQYHCTAFVTQRVFAKHQEGSTHHQILQENFGNQKFHAQCRRVALILNVPN